MLNIIPVNSMSFEIRDDSWHKADLEDNYSFGGWTLVIPERAFETEFTLPELEQIVAKMRELNNNAD